MKFKEFLNWCNDRACDGCWDFNNAVICISTVDAIRIKPFWKREKLWKEKYELDIVSNIVEPTNKLIDDYKLGNPISTSE